MSDKPSLTEIRKRLRAFARIFKDASNEQQQASIFWMKFYECYGIRPESATIYEQRVAMLGGAAGRIDSFIPGKLIVEHKSKGADLEKAYSQAQGYFLALPEAERPQYIITSDFARIHLYDLKNRKTYKTSLAELPKHAAWFRFLIDEPNIVVEETPINRNAAYAISKLHEGLVRVNFKGRPLEIFLTRILFCLFADDTGIFGESQQFRWLVENTKPDGTDLGSRLTDLFGVLDKPEADRQTTLDDELASFAYVNGDLFRERSEIPAFNSDLRKQLLHCVEMDWSEISPAIFGAMFQGVLEEHSPDETRQATRRELGAHYTSERNILRVINPLFMDDLRAEFNSARRNKKKLKALYDRLPTLTFFDPACGCGNFLVIAYREVRRLENEIIAALFDTKTSMGLLDVSTLCRVRVSQFYGIEIDEAAAHIARVAMWITDHQMNEEAAKRFGTTRPTIPLVDSPHIACGNALRMEWNTLLPAEKCSYIFGNPPFVGKKEQNAEQKRDIQLVFGGHMPSGVIDYVAGWYATTLEYIEPDGITEVAFVSTKSITQGEQVAILWGYLLKLGAQIRFAHRTFKWSNEGKGIANVHCVIVGFSNHQPKSCTIYDYPSGVKGEPVARSVSKVNPYLVEADNILIGTRTAPICPSPPMNYGSMPIDNGHLILSSEDRAAIAAEGLGGEKFVRRYMGGKEFLTGTVRYCIWLKDVEPKEFRSSKLVMERIRRCREFRLASGRKETRKLAETPMLFGEIRQPIGEYLLLPKVSSENRTYMPIGFIPADVVASGSALIVPGAGAYQFGVLASQMHMAWMRAVCGRMKSDYQYSASIAYNNFPWAKPSQKQVNDIEEAASKVLAIREKHPGETLADLYDPLSMPPDLLKAHKRLDCIVDAAYGYKGRDEDIGRVEFLFECYQKLTTMFPQSGSRAAKKRTRKSA